ncbi:YidB family protein [Niveibacterium umoris]|uniref:Uncharacterized protein YidB (DUF937 family) n=1 Tax=Niveibacterium umoris TaxID=1193620 RepID=A0A840BKD3_9RHOO|nr:YidB family protein [Niveibacterium umoris]MBB4011346.1 uncharacterized protein YidB (DUF937 family) [Niveibacterium umoris]
MGLLDQLASQVLGGNAGNIDFAKVALDLLQNHPGGLAGLLDQLKAGGLADHAASWVGTGANLPVSGEQLGAALGSDALGALAGRFGVDPSALSGGLAQALPQLVNQLTPNGSLDGHEDLLREGANLIGKLLG